MNIAKTVFRVLWSIDNLPSYLRWRWNEYWFLHEARKELIPCLRDIETELQQKRLPG